jgi:hypothetical protein
MSYWARTGFDRWKTSSPRCAVSGLVPQPLSSIHRLQAVPWEGDQSYRWTRWTSTANSPRLPATLAPPSSVRMVSLIISSSLSGHLHLTAEHATDATVTDLLSHLDLLALNIHITTRSHLLQTRLKSTKTIILSGSPSPVPSAELPAKSSEFWSPDGKLKGVLKMIGDKRYVEVWDWQAGRAVAAKEVTEDVGEFLDDGELSSLALHLRPTFDA